MPTTEPRTWHGITYGPCQVGAAGVRRLFDFAGASAPPAAPDEVAWEATADGRLVGGVIVERHAAAGFVHGPVVVEPPAGTEPLEVAAQLLAPLLTGSPPDALFVRPQGLDRIWVRHGFVPVPEAWLPVPLQGRPGTGLYVWRRPGTYTVATPDPEGGRRRR